MPPTSPTTIPTSFVPKQPVKTGGRFAQGGQNAFLIIAVILLGISIAGAVGIFGIEYYLKGVRAQKATEVAATQAAIDSDAIEDFVRTRDRFSAAQSVLDGHIMSSQFFDLLDRVTLKTVRFSTLSLDVAEDRSGKINVEGVARSFNALAAQSSLLAEERQVKRAIFSDIRVNADSTVSFTLEADIDKDLLTLAASNVVVPVEAAPVAPSTATTTPSASVTSSSTPATTTPR